MIVFLRRPGAEASHHTLAALRIDGRWHPFDPFSGDNFFRKDRPPPGIFQMMKSPEQWPAPPLPENGAAPPLFHPAYLPESQFLVYHDVVGDLPRWILFSRAAGAAEAEVFLTRNPVLRMEEVRQDAAKALDTTPEVISEAIRKLSTSYVDGETPKSGPEKVIIAYGQSYQLLRIYSRPKWKAIQAKSRSSGPFRSARIAYLEGDNESARKKLMTWSPRAALERGMPVEKVASLSSDWMWYLSRIEQAEGRHEQALILLGKLSSEGTGPWSKHTAWPRARILDRMGARTRALELWFAVPPPRHAAARRHAETPRPKTP